MKTLELAKNALARLETAAPKKAKKAPKIPKVLPTFSPKAIAIQTKITALLAKMEAETEKLNAEMFALDDIQDTLEKALKKAVKTPKEDAASEACEKNEAKMRALDSKQFKIEEAYMIKLENLGAALLGAGGAGTSKNMGILGVTEKKLNKKRAELKQELVKLKAAYDKAKGNREKQDKIEEKIELSEYAVDLIKELLEDTLPDVIKAEAESILAKQQVELYAARHGNAYQRDMDTDAIELEDEYERAKREADKNAEKVEDVMGAFYDQIDHEQIL